MENRLSLIGLAITVWGGFLGFGPQFKFPGREILGILLIVLGPALITLGWPALFKVLIAFGYAARIPVAVVMLLALRGHWGTHYDGLPPDYAAPASFFSQYMVIALKPQMVLWIAFHGYWWGRSSGTSRDCFACFRPQPRAWCRVRPDLIS